MVPATTSISPRRGLEPPNRRIRDKKTKTRMIVWPKTLNSEENFVPKSFPLKYLEAQPSKMQY